jgi:hypothetical protein
VAGPAPLGVGVTSSAVADVSAATAAPAAGTYALGVTLGGTTTANNRVTATMQLQIRNT